MKLHFGVIITFLSVWPRILFVGVGRVLDEVLQSKWPR